MILIKFIFPQNYNFKSKLLGVFDYSTAIFDLIWIISIFFISNFVFSSIKFVIISSIILILPVLIFSLIGFNGENIGNVIKYILIYLVRPKVYLFSKQSLKSWSIVKVNSSSREIQLKK